MQGPNSTKTVRLGMFLMPVHDPKKPLAQCFDEDLDERSAVLDVFEEEPPAPDNPLFEMDNVVVSPHIGGEDTLSLERMGIEAAECIIKLYNGEWAAGAALNDDLRDGWKWKM